MKEENREAIDTSASVPDSRSNILRELAHHSHGQDDKQTVRMYVAHMDVHTD